VAMYDILIEAALVLEQFQKIKNENKQLSEDICKIMMNNTSLERVEKQISVISMHSFQILSDFVIQTKSQILEYQD